ncbi:MAG: acyltransferase [Anaerolineales bacterium]|nr:acyltransferase [Anaerolineales bacterium]
MNRSFPALRGVAILLVVLNHTIHMATKYAASANLLNQEPWLHYGLSFLSGLGIFAVPIFLFLSGCFFAYAASRDHRLRSNYKVVWVNVWHVAFPYLIWTLIFYVEIFFLHQERYSLPEYIKNILAGYPFNFVPLLIFYYLVSPILVGLLKRFGWWVIAIIGLYQVLLIMLVHPSAFGFRLSPLFNIFAPPILSTPLADWAIYFPLGLIVVIQANRLSAVVHQYRWALVIITVVLYIFAALSALSILKAPLARYLCPMTFLLLSTNFKRAAIPMVRQLELVGKRAYGIYLMNLLILDVTLFSLSSLSPGALGYYLILLPILFAEVLLISMSLMGTLERAVKPEVYRYVFG